MKTTKKTVAKKTATKKDAKKPKPPGPRTLANFYKAIADGNVEEVAKHLPDLANVAREGKYGGTDPPLSLAAGDVEPRTEIARMLLDAGADIAATCTPMKQTALHVACIRDHVDVVALLVERGSPLDTKNVEGHTPYVCTRHPEIRARLRAAGVAGFAGRGGKKLHPKSKLLKKEPVEADDGMLAVDREGRVWIASHQGIYCTSGDTFTRYTFERDLNGATGWRTTGIGAGPAGKIYIGLGRDGLIEIDGDTFTLFDARNSELLDADKTTTGPDGRVYLISREAEDDWPIPQYITVFDGTAFTRLVAGRDFPEGLEISCLAFAPDGKLVIGAKGAVAFQRDGGWHVERGAGLFDSATIYQIIALGDVTWIGTQRGVVEQRGGSGKLHRTTSLAQHLAIRGDDLYVGLYGYEDGVVRLRDGVIETVAVQGEALPRGMISDLAAGPDGKIWVIVGESVAAL